MSVRRVFSAGGIIFKKGKGEVKVLVTQHSKHKGWEFPKGHLEIPSPYVWNAELLKL